MHIDELKGRVLQALEDMKARDIVTLNVHELTAMTDWMLICSGTSNRHTRAIAQEVVEQVKAAGQLPIGVEGEDSGEWILIDLGAVIVHVMQRETRDYYQLEKLWNPNWGEQSDLQRAPQAKA